MSLKEYIGVLVFGMVGGLILSILLISKGSIILHENTWECSQKLIYNNEVECNIYVRKVPLKSN